MLDVPPNRYVYRDGARIAYSVLGTGPRTLLLANGLGARLYSWEPVVSALTDRYTIITWDYRGLFDSTAPTHEAAMSIGHHAADALAILDAEHINQAVFCGWSMGVQVAIEAATISPERVAGLVLLNGTYGQVFSSALQPFVRLPFAGAYMNAMVEYTAEHPGFARAIESLAPWMVRPAAGLFWLVSHADFHTMAALMKRYTREVFGPETFPNYLRLFQEVDAHSVLHHLKHVHAPSLVISGQWDWLTPAYQSRLMAKRLPDCETLHLRHGSHFVLLEHPEIVLPAIEDFLSRRARWNTPEKSQSTR